MTEEQIPPALRETARGMFSHRPYIEGPWMTKYQGHYYLQYAAPGTECNVYGDGVYIGDGPLGPFVPARNNPYSYKPGGFITGAGHGSTMWGKDGGLWHVSSMYVGRNFDFERRVGLWKAGFDADGELFCNQRFGDWPTAVPEEGEPMGDVWENPEWYLLSYRKPMTASSFQERHEPGFAADENVRTCWRATSGESGEWLCMDLEKDMDVRAIQINFADEGIKLVSPGEIRGTTQARYIDEHPHVTQWKLEGSCDGKEWFVIEDKSAVRTDLPHDLIVREGGIQVRFLKLTIFAVPYGQQPCICGLRVFGIGYGATPNTPQFTVTRTGDLDMEVTMYAENVVGYNILWGTAPDKLYHSRMVYADEEGTNMALRIGALVSGEAYAVRVDAFNESGITEGSNCILI